MMTKKLDILGFLTTISGLFTLDTHGLNLQTAWIKMLPLDQAVHRYNLKDRIGMKALIPIGEAGPVTLVSPQS
jgi:hypothetical protein